MTTGRCIAGSLAIIALAACGGGGSGGSASPLPPIAVTPAPTSAPTPAPAPTPTPSPTPASIEREVSPSSTDATLTANLDPHIAINPSASVAARNKLFVMLPGTGGIPGRSRLILRTGAARGWHVIGLTYPNDEAVQVLCQSSPDADCAGRVRREVITGQDASGLVRVDAANSITGRLVSLIRSLDGQFPAEVWGRFLRAGTVDWSLVTVGGHSQGAGHAGYLAKLVTLDRAAMFSGPGDTGAGPGTSAAWLAEPNITPPARQYAFIHTADDSVPLPLALRNWGLIGLEAFGAAVSVDSAAPPFGGTRQLTTSAQPNQARTTAGGSPEHGATVVDRATPLSTDGTPLFARVWAYMAFPD